MTLDSVSKSILTLLALLPLSMPVCLAQSAEQAAGLSQSGWVKPGGGVSAGSGSGSGMTQSNWIQTAPSAPAPVTGTSTLGQSEWISPSGGSSGSSTLGQSNWISKGSKKKDKGVPIAMGQSGWTAPSQQIDYGQQQPMFQGSVNQNCYGFPSPTFTPAPPTMMGAENMMMGGGMGYANGGGNFGPTDNMGKAMGIASQLGISASPYDDPMGGAMMNNGGTNYGACSRPGFSMPAIPGSGIINRNADRFLQRVVNRAIQKF